ncbi:hypothetical protein LRS06_07545 [Hymenobacter sp. J193]|uniref:hypothetical protein n=1 Tax=Hymenobacter sp. J193 TaxID=2898429 RepID=UPI002151A9A9|nr:hypothetical protein [Hymenobacter sp. J193]MCR5887633.1 hypothetical protein [Hymenobacter sp. J193]
MSKHKKDNPTSNQLGDSAMGPDALNHTPESVDPATRGSGNVTQNAKQNFITETGNQIKNNTPGGNAEEQRRGNTNKPRNNPQGNWPMSVDKSQKGPGSKAD